MKRFFSIILLLCMVFSAVLSFVSCGEIEFDPNEVWAGTAMITASDGDSAAGSQAVTAQSVPETTEESVAPYEPPAGLDPQLQDMLENMLREKNFSGVVRVSKNGQVLCEAANGKISSESDEDITPNTLFPIASCSKQFTAACILLLKQDGKLSVDDTIDKYFPEYKYGKDITVKLLLTMRSGIADFLNDNLSFAKYNADPNADEQENREVTRNWIFKKKLNYLPDRVYYYSNSNYFLLAEIVEKVSGMSFSQFLKQRVFEPLGMKNTGVNEELAYSSRLALSEPDPWDLPKLKAEPHPLTVRIKGFNFGNGGLISTAADMDKWMTSLREYTILTKESVKEMTKDYNPDYVHYGYGVKIADNGACWHVGSLDYYASYTYTIPKKGYNLFAVTNNKIGMNTDIYTFTSDIIKKTK